ncbi:MAG: Abi family protein [Spiroplasma sp.]
MGLSERWIAENIVDEKYLEQLKKTYPNHDLKKLLLLNVDLRLLYLKHLFMIENSLKNVLLRQTFINELQNLENSYFLNQEHLKKLRTARRVIRTGYYKYHRNGILKSKTIRSLIEVMSFESIMNLLQTLNDDNLKKIAKYFGLNEYNSSDILLEQLEYLKNIRNYLSHNFKILNVYFNQKRSNNNFYQQELAANNDHHYLHLLINRYSSKNQLLLNFTEEYQKLFQSYKVSLNDTIISSTNSVNFNITNGNGVK